MYWEIATKRGQDFYWKWLIYSKSLKVEFGNGVLMERLYRKECLSRWMTSEARFQPIYRFNEAINWGWLGWRRSNLVPFSHRSKWNARKKLAGSALGASQEKKVIDEQWIRNAYFSKSFKKCDRIISTWKMPCNCNKQCLHNVDAQQPGRLK